MRLRTMAVSLALCLVVSWAWAEEAPPVPLKVEPMEHCVQAETIMNQYFRMAAATLAERQVMAEKLTHRVIELEKEIAALKATIPKDEGPEKAKP